MNLGALVLEEVHNVVFGCTIHHSVMLFVFLKVQTMELLDVFNSQDDVQLWGCLEEVNNK